MDAIDKLTGRSLAIAFVAGPEETRYSIIEDNLDSLLEYIQKCPVNERDVSRMVELTAASMYLRYMTYVNGCTTLYCNIHGVEMPSDELQLDALHRQMAGLAGYPAEAAMRLFDALVVDQKLLYDVIVLRKPIDETERASNVRNDKEVQWQGWASQFIVELEMWYEQQHGGNGRVSLPISSCLRCLRDGSACLLNSGPRYTACMRCAVLGKWCSLANTEADPSQANLEYSMAQLSSEIHRLISTAGSALQRSASPSIKS